MTIQKNGIGIFVIHSHAFSLLTTVSLLSVTSLVAQTFSVTDEASFNAALRAAKSGDTISLQNDISLTNNADVMPAETGSPITVTSVAPYYTVNGGSHIIFITKAHLDLQQIGVSSTSPMAVTLEGNGQFLTGATFSEAANFPGGIRVLEKCLLDFTYTPVSIGGTLTFSNEGAAQFFGGVTGGPTNITYSGQMINAGDLIFDSNNSSSVFHFTGSGPQVSNLTVKKGTFFVEGAGSLSSSCNLTVEGSALFDLSGISGSSLTLGDLSGAGGVGVGTKTLSVGTANSTTFSGIVDGTGSFVKQGVGTLTLTGGLTDLFQATIAEGKLALSLAGGLAVQNLIVNSGATFDISGVSDSSATIQDLSGAGTVYLGSKNLILGTGDSTSFSGVFTGEGGITKQGTGLLTLSGVSVEPLFTTIKEGTLALSGSGSLPPLIMLMVDASGTFDITLVTTGTTIGDLTGSGTINLGSKTLTVGTADSTTFSGVIHGSGLFAKQGTGILTLTGGSDYSGGTHLNQGILTVGNASALGTGVLTTAAGTTLAINNGITCANNMTLGNRTILSVPVGTGTLSGVLSGNDLIEKRGGGTLVLSAAATGIVGTAIAEGTLSLSGSGALPAASFISLSTGASFDISAVTSSTTIGDLLGRGTVKLGAKTLNVGTGANATYLGLITGTGVLTKQNAGALSLHGTSTYSGGTTLSGGAIRVYNDKALGTGTVTAASGTTLVLQDGITFANTMVSNGSAIKVESGSAVFSGSISGTTLAKTGDGDLNLTGSAALSGAVTLSEGSLFANSYLSAPSVLVAAPATLLGGGTIASNVTVNGAMAPGNSVGTLTIQGDYTQAAGSTFEGEVTDTQTDRLVVSGAVTIEPNTTFVFLPQVRAFSDLTSYTVISGASVTGEFTHFTNTSRAVRASLEYLSDAVLLNIDITNLADLVSGKGNAYHVAVALDQINDSQISFGLGATETVPSTWDAAIDSLFALTDTELYYALNQLDPVQYKDMGIIQQNSSVKVHDALGMRFQRVLDTVRCALEKDKWNVWLNGFGDFSTQKSLEFAFSPQVGYHSQTGGVVTGGDFQCIEHLYFGVLGAYTYSDVRFASSQGKGHINSGYAGVYSSYVDKLFYGNVAVLGGWSHYESTRNIIYPGVFATAKMHRPGKQILTHADTGVNFRFGGVTIRPFDAFDYIVQKENGFTETGAGLYNLEVQASTLQMIRNELGLNFAKCFAYTDFKWAVDAKLSWVREVRFKGEDYIAEFEGTGVNFTTIGYFPNRSLFSPGVNFTFELLEDSLVLNTYYNGEFSYTKTEVEYRDQSVGLEVEYRF